MYTYVFSMLAPPARPKELDGSTSTNGVAQSCVESDTAATNADETSVSMPLLVLNGVPPPRPQVHF